MLNKWKYRFQVWMTGRYGPDKLSNHMVYLGLVMVLISLFTKWQILLWIGYAIFILAYVRVFSKNRVRRLQEYRSYERLLGNIRKGIKRVRDFPHYKLIRCPACKQKMRLPRGKKQVVVTCPKCGHRFDARS